MGNSSVFYNSENLLFLLYKLNIQSDDCYDKYLTIGAIKQYEYEQQMLAEEWHQREMLEAYK